MAEVAGAKVLYPCYLSASLLHRILTLHSKKAITSVAEFDFLRELVKDVEDSEPDKQKRG